MSSIESGVPATPSRVAMGQHGPRLGRRLVWLTRIMILVSAWSLWQQTVVVLAVWVQAADRDGLLLFLAKTNGPNMLAWLCLILAALALRSWRQARGLQVACGLIWLAPVLALCGEIINEHIGRDPQAALPLFFTAALRVGAFHAAGFTAFLLGIAPVRDAYGLKLTGFAPASSATGAGGTIGADGTAGWRPSWLGVLRCYLLLPLLVFLPMMQRSFGLHQAYWFNHETAQMLVSIAFAGIPLIAAAMLGKYQGRVSLAFAIAVLWLMAALDWSQGLWRVYSPPFAGLETIARLPHMFGFTGFAAFAWTLYLLSAPEIRRAYLGPAVREVDIDVF